MRRCVWETLGLLVLLLWLPWNSVADTSALPAPAAEVQAATTQESGETGDIEELRDPEALAELKRATDFLTALRHLQFSAIVAYDVIQKDGRRLQFEKVGEVSLQRPDRLFARVLLDDGRQRHFWYDGKTLSVAELSQKVHARVPAPPTLDGMLDMLEELARDPMPLADLLYNDLSSLERRALEADFVGDSLVDGRPCSQLAFRGETVDWQLWIEQGERPFIRKVAIGYREQPGVPQFVAWLDDWQTPEKFDDKLFTFVPPEGSRQIELLMAKPSELLEGGQP